MLYNSTDFAYKACNKTVQTHTTVHCFQTIACVYSLVSTKSYVPQLQTDVFSVFVVKHDVCLEIYIEKRPRLVFHQFVQCVPCMHHCNAYLHARDVFMYDDCMMTVPFVYDVNDRKLCHNNVKICCYNQTFKKLKSTEITGNCYGPRAFRDSNELKQGREMTAKPLVKTQNNSEYCAALFQYVEQR